MPKDISEIRQTFATAKLDAINDDNLKMRFRSQFHETLSSPPYNLTTEDINLAHEDSVKQNPQCPYYCLAGTVGKL